MVAAIRSDEVKLVTLTTVKSPKRVEDPTFPAKVIFPVPAVKVKAPGPSTVLEKRIFPMPLPVLRTVAPVKLTAPANWIVSLVVVIDPADWVVPTPD